MNRTKWITYIQNDFNEWEEDGFIYAPNENQERNKTGTLIQVKLANGANAYASPEVKYNWEPITFVYISIDHSNPDEAEFVENINDYIDNATFIKITDNEGGEITGIFTSIQEVWMVGEKDCKDYMVNFARCVDA